jgi:uncharacterized protein (TIGR02453 family)
MPSDDDRFAGFGADFPAFFAGLEADNSKAWFDARRDVYERAIREPLERLVAEARGAYGTYAKVFRANRDVRFSADKRPYRTDAVGGVADERTRVISYVRLDRDGLVAGAGWLHPDRDQLATARAAIATDAGAARELQRAFDDLAAGGFDCDGELLRTAPRGYPRDHPAIALLRRRRFAAERRFTSAADLADPAGARAAVFGTWEAARPLTGWLASRAAPPPG